MSRPRRLNYNGNFHVIDYYGQYRLEFEYKGKKKILPYDAMSRQGLFYKKRKLQKDFEFFCDIMDIDV